MRRSAWDALARKPEAVAARASAPVPTRGARPEFCFGRRSGRRVRRSARLRERPSRSPLQTFLTCRPSVAATPFPVARWRRDKATARISRFRPVRRVTMAVMAVAQETIDHLRTTGLEEVDPQIADLLGRELERQRNQIELIASENFTWPSILEAIGSTPTNKYAEGYPGRRYYGGGGGVGDNPQNPDR